MPSIRERNTKGKKVKVIQLNLNNCEAAQDLVSQTVRELEVDVAILCEQYRNPGVANWGSDATRRAAIWACGNEAFQETSRIAKMGFTSAKIQGIYFYSCYASPNDSFEEFTNFLDRLVNDAKDRRPLVIAGDFNAWATEWGSTRTNSRGEAVLEALAPLNLVLCNQGSTFTFRRGITGSVVDLTFVSETILKRGIGWKVLEEYTHSDHMAILVEIGKHHSTQRLASAAGWNSRGFDQEMFKLLLRVETVIGDANIKAKSLMNSVIEACDASMPRKGRTNRRPPVYWWTAEIANLRKISNNKRRVCQRARESTLFPARLREYKSARLDLKHAIKASKKRCWDKLISEVDQDTWGRPYRTVMAKFKRSCGPTCPKLMANIVTNLFPTHPRITHEGYTTPREEFQPISEDELIAACKKIPPSKAPGMDNIPNVALKLAMKECAPEFVEVYNSCLREGVFPAQWKRQRLVLIPKANKPPGEPSSYRPICMLDTAGKVLERIICTRIEKAVEKEGGLAQNQFGFRKGHSTVDAIDLVAGIARKAVEGKRWKGGSKKYCAIITLDVKNAFNSARWVKILEALDRSRIPGYIMKIVNNYFSGRTLIYNTSEGPKEYAVTGGVPQGSVLGPLLWNLMYDGILRVKVPDGVKVVGFADDVAVVVTAKEISELEETCSYTVAILSEWLSTAGLSLAEHKTEAVLVTSRRIRETLTFRVGDTLVTSKPAIRYLGVIIDARLSFKDHINEVCCKAAEVSGYLSRIMPNIGGPRQSRRRLLCGVVSSILLYGAPVWARAMQVQAYKTAIQSVYRRIVLRAICGFRSVSNDAVCVIAGMIPIDILAKERQELYQARKSNGTRRETLGSLQKRLRKESMVEWQGRWDQSADGRWTHRLIPNVVEWTGRSHGDVGYYLTQLLSGHGCFRVYLNRIGQVDSPNCPMCEMPEDVEHVLSHCPRFMKARHELEKSTGRGTAPESVVEAMLSSSVIWEEVSKFATEVINQLSCDVRSGRSRHRTGV